MMPMARTTTELAEMLNYRMRERLGAGVDYRATLIPNELAIQVEMLAPERLRGFQFIFREGERLPALLMDPGQPGAIPLTYNYNPELRTWAPAPFTLNETQAAQMGALMHRMEVAPVIPNGVIETYRQFVEHAEQITGGTRTMAPDATATNTATNTVPTIPIRTAEQERRLAVLARLATSPGVFMSLSDSEEYHRLGAMAPWSPPPSPQQGPRIRVRVWRDDYQTWNITCRVDNNAIELPPIAVIKALLPPADKRHLPSRQSRYRNTTGMLKTALQAGLPAESLRDALRAWLIASRAGVTNAEYDGNMLADDLSPLLIAQPATLEVGGKVYRLVPTNEMDTRPLIRRVRARALTVAKVQGDAILAKSRTDAQVVVREAERRAANLRAELEAERARAGSRVPEWVVRSMRPHCFYDGYWRVEIKVACKVREIRYTVAPWATVLYWNPIRIPGKDDSYYNNRKMPLWVRLSDEGHYDKNNIYAKEWACTHINDYMCMELQGLPPALTSNTHLQELESVISRGMMVVNLNSPLCTTPDRYWPDFREQIHPIPIRLMTTMGRSDNYIVPGMQQSMERYKAEHPENAWDRFETIQQETDGIFRVSADSPGTPTHRAVR